MFEAHREGRLVEADKAALWGRLKLWFLQEVFASKCAYCEGDVSAHAPQHAEHWRPKGKVTRFSENGEEIVVARDGDEHPGYWWLAYNWENLVPACDFCNTAGAKGTKFPIEGQYAFSPEEGLDVAALNAREQPLLLHPWGEQNPECHIGFYDDGSAYAKNKSDYGYWTITVMNLNRENLVNARRKRQEEAVDAFGQAASDAIRFDKDLDEVMQRWDGPRAAYSRAVGDRLSPIRGRVGPQIYGQN
ncbi:MAG: hypothetical protein ACJ768_20570 [Gaiellaceae bacterium]